MKAKKTTLLVVVVTALVLYNCTRRWGSSTLKDYSICTNYSNQTVSELPIPLIHDMVDQYRENQLVEITGVQKNKAGLKDAHSIWFDLETLKRFIYQVEHETVKKDPTKSLQDLGIRIYYSAYPEETRWGNRNYNGVLVPFRTHVERQKYGMHHTLVMIPTRKQGNLNIDFNPLDINTYTTRLHALSKYQKIPRNPSRSLLNETDDPIKTAETTMALSGTTTSQNHGSMIPPRDPSLDEEGF